MCVYTLGYRRETQDLKEPLKKYLMKTTEPTQQDENYIRIIQQFI